MKRTHLVAAGVLVIGLTAMFSAWSAHGERFPGLMLDPYLSFSAVYLPSWNLDNAPVRFPDQLVAVDGVRAHDRASLKRVLQDALRARDVVELHFARGNQTLSVSRPVLTVGAVECVFFFGLFLLSGVFILWSAHVVARLGHGESARAYITWSVCSFGFLATFFDFHTTALLVPLFWISAVGVGLGALWLGLEFPTPILSRRRRNLLLVTVAVPCIGCVAAVSVLEAPAASLRLATGSVANVGMLALFAILVVRYARGTKTARLQLQTVLIGLVAVPFLIATTIALGAVTGSGIGNLLLPFLAPLLPVSIGVAIIRHGLLESRGPIVTSALTIVPALLVAGMSAALVVLAGLPVGPVAVLWPTTVFALVFVLTRRVIKIMLVERAHRFFRPTLTALTDSAISDDDAVAFEQVTRDVVSRWLGVEPTFSSGVEQNDTAALVVPIGRGHGGEALVVPTPPGRRMFTDADTELLSAVAAIASITRHNQRARDDLTELAELRVKLAEADRRGAIALMSAEIVHELNHPLNFFRFLLRELESGDGIVNDDLNLARDEIQRLESMAAALRRGSREPASAAESVNLHLCVSDAVRVLAPRLNSVPEIEVNPDVWLSCPKGGLSQLISNLLRNADEAATSQFGVVGDQSELVVWDDGPGVSPEIESRLFESWISTKPGGLGLGLGLASRLARDAGWQLRYRRNGRTEFVVRFC